MKEIAVVLSDDLDWAEKRERVPADGTATISFGWVPSDAGGMPAIREAVYELDLTGKHAEELRELLEPYMEAGREPEDGRGQGPAARRKGQFAPGILDYKRGLRAWADANVIRSRSRKGPDRPAYMTTTGKYTYPKWLREAYDRYLREGQSGIPGAR